LEGFARALASSPEALALLSEPGHADRSEAGVPERSDFAALGISKTIGDFILLLLDKKRLYLPLLRLRPATGSFGDEAAGILRAAITSALPLTESQVNELRSALEKSTGKKVVLDVATDPSLIGGVVSRIGDKVLDGSIRTQLAKIQELLQKG
jgi:F-type H+-transporting ATPase subunit delta